MGSKSGAKSQEPKHSIRIRGQIDRPVGAKPIPIPPWARKPGAADLQGWCPGNVNVVSWAHTKLPQESRSDPKQVARKVLELIKDYASEREMITEWTKEVRVAIDVLERISIVDDEEHQQAKDMVLKLLATFKDDDRRFLINPPKVGPGRPSEDSKDCLVTYLMALGLKPKAISDLLLECGGNTEDYSYQRIMNQCRRLRPRMEDPKWKALFPRWKKP